MNISIKSNLYLPIFICIFILCNLTTSTYAQDRIENNFKNANGPAPYTLWQWMNGCVTKEGITYDLEAFKKVGIKNVQQFLVGGSEADVTDPSVVILGDKWNDLMRYSLDECNRLGMDFGTHNSPGWSSSGAPGLEVQYSMQKLVWTKTQITGEASKKTTIKRAEVDSKWNYYKDICLIAIPKDLALIDKDKVIIIIDGLDKDDKLKKQLPKGNWDLIRFGHTTAGKMNLTAPESGQGLEVDKMSRKALDHFWSLYPSKLIEIAGKDAGTTFKRLEIDSYEVGDQDWTPEMTSEFKKRSGYELLPWLPVIAGYTIESAAISNRFKSDWQRTINQLFADNYYSYLEELTHKVPGMEFLCEPYGTGHKNFDETAIRGIGDMVMCEFWTKPTKWGWETILPVSSNAHVNGKKIVAAEAFTGQPQYAWQTDLEDLKSTGDLAFCEGVNLFILHAAAHQPWPKFKPGMTMGWWGTQFGPSQTWWEHGAEQWIQYLSRCQLLLQKGLFEADICYLQLYSQKNTRIPKGYKADVCNEKELISRFSVDGNKLLLPDGMRYKILILPNKCRIELALARKIESLVNDGAIVVGNGFTGTQGLINYPQNDDEVKAISDRLFGLHSENKDTKKSIRNIGKGKVYYNYSPEETLAEEQISKDVEIVNNSEDIAWIHRSDLDSHYYFISNQSANNKSYQISFRVTDMQPEIWNAMSGEINDALIWETKNNRTIVNLKLDTNGSCFVVFKSKVKTNNIIYKSLTLKDKAVDINSYLFQNKNQLKLILNEQGNYKITTQDGNVISKNHKNQSEKIALNKNWDISFEENRGAPANAHLDSLISLSKHNNLAIKYFSGTAHYSKSIQLNQKQLKKSNQIFLDLGQVENIAAVTINNQKVATLWKAPYAVDITEFCKPGNNLIEIDVTNLWPNRMIGDKFEPDDLDWGKVRDFPYVNPVPVIGRNLQLIPDWVKNGTERPSKNRVTFSTMDFFDKETPLLPSGLIGPVQMNINETLDLPLSK
ncbi:MAG: glycosyl hydrolase [Bacteroidota bacterium]